MNLKREAATGEEGAVMIRTHMQTPHGLPLCDWNVNMEPVVEFGNINEFYAEFPCHECCRVIESAEKRATELAAHLMVSGRVLVYAPGVAPYLRPMTDVEAVVRAREHVLHGLRNVRLWDEVQP